MWWSLTAWRAVAAVVRIRPVHNRPVVVLRVVRAGVTAVAGAVVTLAQLNLPDRQFWGERVALQWAAVLVVAVFIGYEAVRSVNYAVQAARIREYDNDLRSVLSAALSAVVLSTGAPWDALSVHYYRRRGFLYRRRLVEMAALRAGAEVADPQQVFRPGVGPVGTAFSTQEVVAVRWREFARAATRLGATEWEQRDETGRYGLSWGQLRRSARPEGMVASPTFAADGRPSGCVVISGPLKLPELGGDEMRQTLDSLGTTLDRLGPAPAGWWGARGR